MPGGAGAGEQITAGNQFYSALWRGIWPRLGFSLGPITPARLTGKRAVGDLFLETVLKDQTPFFAADG